MDTAEGSCRNNMFSLMFVSTSKFTMDRNLNMWFTFVHVLTVQGVDAKDIVVLCLLTYVDKCLAAKGKAGPKCIPQATEKKDKRQRRQHIFVLLVMIKIASGFPIMIISRINAAAGTPPLSLCFFSLTSTSVDGSKVEMLPSPR